MRKLSPAARHYQQTIAARSAQTQESGDRVRENASAYELQLAQLAEDRKRLKKIQSEEAKAELKKELIPSYMDWINGVINGGSTSHEDIVLVTIMIWMIDTGDIKAAVPLARFAIENSLTLPDQYVRKLPVAVADEVGTISLRYRESKGIDVESIAEIIDITADQDMPDQARARLHKALGLGSIDLASTCLDEVEKAKKLSLALQNLHRALELDEKSGVKKDIENLERTIKNLASPPTEQSTGSQLPATMLQRVKALFSFGGEA